MNYTKLDQYQTKNDKISDFGEKEEEYGGQGGRSGTRCSAWYACTARESGPMAHRERKSKKK